MKPPDVSITYFQCKLSLPGNRLLLYCDHQDGARTSFITSVKLAIFQVLTVTHLRIRVLATTSLLNDRNHSTKDVVSHPRRPETNNFL